MEIARTVFMTMKIERGKRRNTSNDILNTSSHWDNMVSHRDDKMQDKYMLSAPQEGITRPQL